MSATSFSSLLDASERRDSYTMSLRIHDIFAYLYNKVDGQTWYIQDILNRLYQNGKEITTAEIDDVTLELVNEQEVAFVNYYDSLTDNQAALLSAIAQDKAHCKKSETDSCQCFCFGLSFRILSYSSLNDLIHTDL